MSSLKPYRRDDFLLSIEHTRFVVERWRHNIEIPEPSDRAGLVADVAARHAEAVAQAEAWRILEAEIRSLIASDIGALQTQLAEATTPDDTATPAIDPDDE
ncbi:MAG: hypothetical protein KDB16_19355 [Acidimicrobiales bacterium]|nr:hypothetical protein [Acidimicrobiales bacterium]